MKVKIILFFKRIWTMVLIFLGKECKLMGGEEKLMWYIFMDMI